MALPKLNAVPKYDMVIPSTGKSVRFRPFLVKEEKVLMLAAESEDPKQMVRALAEMVESCVQEDIDRASLTSTDVEYAFLKIRSKSVGETTTLGMKCKHCEHANEIKINLDNISPPGGGKLRDKIELEKNLFIELQQPTFDGIMEQAIEEAESSIDQILNMITSCVAAIVTENEYIKAEDISQEEMKEFISSMNTQQFSRVREFIEQLPKLSHAVEFKCESCGKKTTKSIEGIQAFLS